MHKLFLKPSWPYSASIVFIWWFVLKWRYLFNMASSLYIDFNIVILYLYMYTWCHLLMTVLLQNYTKIMTCRNTYFVPNEIKQLTHWGRVTHICIDDLSIIGPDNGLSPGRRQAIIWTNAGILLIGPCRTNLSDILIGIQIYSFKKMHL